MIIPSWNTYATGNIFKVVWIAILEANTVVATHVSKIYDLFVQCSKASTKHWTNVLPNWLLEVFAYGMSLLIFDFRSDIFSFLNI